ncbi:helix-turn-helix domain-containing protein, partial [Streptomyces hydrogenans]|uniref:helix-turn-helix domain-containing protein n=1 Tax=Streptomyces hydrogenans TaxID=1873719 RepID=UPI0035D9E77B
MTRTGERQAVVAAALGLSQAQVSRKQSGAAHWSLEDVDGLAAHYGISVLDLLAGPTHAVGVLHGATRSLQPGVLAVPPVRLARAAPAPLPAGTPAEAPESEAVGVPRLSVGLCVLCGQPAADEVDGFPQHLSAEECAEAAAAPAPRPAAVVPPTAPVAVPADVPPAPAASAAAPADVPPAPGAPAAPGAAPAAAAPPAAAGVRRTGGAADAAGSG